MKLKYDPATLPERMRHLPVSKTGWLVPAFVERINGEPDFRVMNPVHLRRCIKEHLCWVCGSRLGRFKTFVVGPMCAINRISSEPPSHKECARWSAKNCPFLTRPHMRRREDGLPDAVCPMGGIALPRNPGVMLLWTTTYFEVVSDGLGKGGKVIEMGEPENLEWWAEGRMATEEEINESIRTGMPHLEELAAQQKGGMEALAEQVQLFERTRALFV